MTRKTMLGLSLCYLAVFTMGNGFLPLMPIYAEKLGATEEIAGFYLAFAFLCVSAGALLGGRVSDLVRNRRLVLAAVGAAAVPATWLIGRVHNVAQLSIVTGAGWLLAGMSLGIVGAIVGKLAAPEERGRLFGILGVTISLGSLLGGFTFGRMAEVWGYGGMFTVVGLFMAIVPAAAILLVAEKPLDPATGTTELPGKARVATGAFLLILLAVILAWVAAGAGNMGRSISMDERGFSKAAITVTAAVGGIVSLPFPLILGWISDRVGRKSVIIASFLAGTACLLLLVVSRTLWQFWGAAALMSLHAISMSIGPAYAADIVGKERVGTAVSFIQSSTWIGTVIGYIYSGIAFQHYGMRPGLLVAAAFPLLAAILLLVIRKRPNASQTSIASPIASRASTA
jgi:MFS family permease